MKISTSKLLRIAGLGIAAAMALSTLAGCAAGTGDRSASDSDWSSHHVMRYYGGPKLPMYAAPRE